MSFDAKRERKRKERRCLNPFGTGQCLSTKVVALGLMVNPVSIPLEQGNVFRPSFKAFDAIKGKLSQSLWNRAMSFDNCLVID